MYSFHSCCNTFTFIVPGQRVAVAHNRTALRLVVLASLELPLIAPASTIFLEKGGHYTCKNLMALPQNQSY